MRIVLFLMLILSSIDAHGDEAYLIIDSVLMPQTSKQPTWIALKKGLKVFHIPVGEVIVSVDPGKYSLEHIDFQKHKASGFGTINVVDRRKIQFEAINNSITYVGLIELEPDGWDRSLEKQYKINLQATVKLLEWACNNKPDLLTRLPVRFRQNNDSVKEILVRCEN